MLTFLFQTTKNVEQAAKPTNVLPKKKIIKVIEYMTFIISILIKIILFFSYLFVYSLRIVFVFCVFRLMQMNQLSKSPFLIMNYQFPMYPIKVYQVLKFLLLNAELYLNLISLLRSRVKHLLLSPSL